MANTTTKKEKKEAFTVVENPGWPFEEGVWRERTWTDHPEVWANICQFSDCSLFLTTTITRGKCLVRHFVHNDTFSQHWHVMWAQLSRREMWCIITFGRRLPRRLFKVRHHLLAVATEIGVKQDQTCFFVYKTTLYSV